MKIKKKIKEFYLSQCLVNFSIMHEDFSEENAFSQIISVGPGGMCNLSLIVENTFGSSEQASVIRKSEKLDDHSDDHRIIDIAQIRVLDGVNK